MKQGLNTRKIEFNMKNVKKVMIVLMITLEKRTDERIQWEGHFIAFDKTFSRIWKQNATERTLQLYIMFSGTIL